MTGPQGLCLLAPIRGRQADWPAAVELDVQPLRREPLTARQEQILAYIADYLDEHGYPPSLREIGEAVGYKSPQTAAYQVRVLREGGWLAGPDEARRARSLRLIQGGA